MIEEPSAATIDLSEPLPKSMVSCLVGQFASSDDEEVDIVLDPDPSTESADLIAAVQAAVSAPEPPPPVIAEAPLPMPVRPAAELPVPVVPELDQPAPRTLTPLAVDPGPCLLREPAPLKIAKTPHPTVRKSSTPPPSISDRWDPTLPEARRRPKPLRVQLRRRPAREKVLTNPIDMEFFARAFKVFAVLTFAVALLAVDLRFGRSIALESDAFAFLRMLAHMSIGAGIVAMLRAK
jgi:hypothetical protein